MMIAHHIALAAVALTSIASSSPNTSHSLRTVNDRNLCQPVPAGQCTLRIVKTWTTPFIAPSDSDAARAAKQAVLNPQVQALDHTCAEMAPPWRLPARFGGPFAPGGGLLGEVDVTIREDEFGVWGASAATVPLTIAVRLGDVETVVVGKDVCRQCIEPGMNAGYPGCDEGFCCRVVFPCDGWQKK